MALRNSIPYQVELEWVGPNIVTDNLSRFFYSGVLREPGEEAGLLQTSLATVVKGGASQIL